ncbi:MAG: exodeoxyribonuclease VII small subunit, partial [Leptospiraceae bacterium]|nr:exodeoxyribonuclease VII small subunit [Leptospiraceae bacterium]
MSKISFEDALKELEKIAEKLEKGQLTLEESIKAYERGMELKKICTDRLKEAEGKIELLTKS